MRAGFDAAGDMKRFVASRAEGGGKAGGIAACIDARAHTGRRADAGEDAEARIKAATDYAFTHLEDQPEVRDWVWTD